MMNYRLLRRPTWKYTFRIPDPLRKSLYAIDHFDLLMKIMVIFTISITLKKHEQDEFLDKYKLNDRPSLGHWVGALAKLQKIEGAHLDLPLYLQAHSAGS